MKASYLDITFIQKKHQLNEQMIIYVLEWQSVYALMWVLFWCLFPELRGSYGNMHQNTKVRAYVVRHDITYIILFFTRHDEIPYTIYITFFRQMYLQELLTFFYCQCISFVYMRIHA